MLDLGADVGSTADYFLLKGASYVIAVEARVDLVRQMKKNLVERLGVAAFNVRPIQEVIQSAAQIENLVTRFHPDVVKLDINGAQFGKAYVEGELWQMSPAILRSVPEWLVELHTAELKEKVLACMACRGFTLKQLEGRVAYFRLAS